MKRFRIFLMLILMAVLALPALAKKEDGEGKWKHQEGENQEKGKDSKLQLTDDQKPKFKAITEERKETEKAHKARMKDLHEQLKNLLGADKPDPTAVKKLLSDIKSERSNQQKNMESNQAKLEGILTPIQLGMMELKRFGHEGNKGHGEWKERGEKNEEREGDEREEGKHHGHHGHHGHGEDNDE